MPRTYVVAVPPGVAETVTEKSFSPNVAGGSSSWTTQVAAGASCVVGVHVVPLPSTSSLAWVPAFVASLPTERSPDVKSPSLRTVKVYGIVDLEPISTVLSAAGVVIVVPCTIVRVAAICPAPVRNTTAVPPVAADADRVAVSAPRAVGARWAFTVQVAPLASDCPVHPSAVTTNCVASLPESETVMGLVGTPPGLLSVNVASGPVLPTSAPPRSCIVSEKSSAPGAAAVPESAAVAVPTWSAAVFVSIAVDALGANVAVTVHVAPGASVLPWQPLPSTAKSAASAPSSVTASALDVAPVPFDTVYENTGELKPVTTTP